jgi:hypothetical protein
MNEPERLTRSGAGPIEDPGATPRVPLPRTGEASTDLPTSEWFGEFRSGFAELDSEIAELESEVADLESTLHRLRPETRSVSRPIAPTAPVDPVDPVAPVAAETAVVPVARIVAAEAPAAEPRFYPAHQDVLRRPEVRQPRTLRGGYLVWPLVLLLVLAVIVGGWQLVRGQGIEAAPKPDFVAATPTSPVSLPDNGSFVQSTVLANGAIEVQHWIRTKGIFRLSLSVPTLSVEEKVRASDVEVVADGKPLFGSSTIDEVARTNYPEGAIDIYISYVLSGAVARTTSAPGRALARITALDVGYDVEGGVSQRRIEGANVLSLACFPRSTGGSRVHPCGNADDGAWEVTLTGGVRDDRVMAQFDQG